MKYLFLAVLLLSTWVLAMPLNTYRIRSHTNENSVTRWQEADGFRIKLCPATEAVVDMLLSLAPDPEGITECEMATLPEVGCLRVYRIERCKQ